MYICPRYPPMKFEGGQHRALKLQVLKNASMENISTKRQNVSVEKQTQKTSTLCTRMENASTENSSTKCVETLMTGNGHCFICRGSINTSYTTVQFYN